MTSQQLPERRPKLIDLNLLPAEFLPRKVSKLNVVLVILVVVMLCLPLPLIFLKADVDADIAPLETKHNQLKAKLFELNTIKIEGEALEAQIIAAENALAAIEQDYETFLQSLVLWSEIIWEIDDLIPGKRVTVSKIQQGGSGITLEGSATKDDYVWDYATALDESECFSGVTPTSIVVTGAGVTFTMTVPFSEGGCQ